MPESASDKALRFFDTRCEKADHDRAAEDAAYLLNAEDWPSKKTPISAKMVGNLARAYIERCDDINNAIENAELIVETAKKATDNDGTSVEEAAYAQGRKDAARVILLSFSGTTSVRPST